MSTKRNGHAKNGHASANGATKRKRAVRPPTGVRRPTLIVIGGREDKVGDALILREVARHVGSGKLVVTAVASSDPDGLFEEYERVFRNLGVRHVSNLDVREREQAKDKKMVSILDDANAVFFTGGDQLKITSQIGDTPVFNRIREIYRGGGLVAGTSAGASVVCSTMLVGGVARTSPRLGDSVQMAPGLGFIRDVIIDQHFAERGRMGRLLGAVAQNPKTLGLGIDENTAVVIDGHETFYVVGAGAVCRRWTLRQLLERERIRFREDARGLRSEASRPHGRRPLRSPIAAADQFRRRGADSHARGSGAELGVTRVAEPTAL
jgi:cyanophycinase